MGPHLTAFLLIVFGAFLEFQFPFASILAAAQEIFLQAARVLIPIPAFSFEHNRMF
jgi:hypothetical protein